MNSNGTNNVIISSGALGTCHGSFLCLIQCPAGTTLEEKGEIVIGVIEKFGEKHPKFIKSVLCNRNVSCFMIEIPPKNPA